MTTTLVANLATKHGPRILQAIRDAGETGMTDHELERELGIYLSSVNAARNTLMRQGKVERSGKLRPSGRGGTATVWVAA